MNSKPLIEPLVDRADVGIEFAVPSHLLGLVESGAVSTALMSVVDYQACEHELWLVPAGMIGCDGPTLTVRLFSRVEPSKIRVVHGDTDSHTSIILCQVILRQGYGVNAEMRGFSAHEGEHWRGPGGPETMLLIGDKVVNAAPDPQDYPFQLDLGEEWKRLTGLPFVFAMWMMRRDMVDVELVGLLDEARRRGAGMTGELLDRYCVAKGWPRELARRYFTEYLRYEVTGPARQGLARFFEWAGRLGLLDVRRPAAYFEVPRVGV